MHTEIEELQRRKRELKGAKNEVEQAALLEQYSEQDRDEVLQLLAEFIYEVMILKDNHRRTQWIMERLEIDAEEGGERGTLAPELSCHGWQCLFFLSLRPVVDSCA